MIKLNLYLMDSHFVFFIIEVRKLIFDVIILMLKPEYEHWKRKAISAIYKAHSSLHING